MSGYAHVILSFSDFTSGRMSEAVEHARRGLELDPDSYLACWCLAISLRCNAQFEQAAVAAERALSMSGRHSWALTTLVTIYAAWQRPDKARATYQELQDRSTGEYVQPSMLAAASAAVGDVDQAIAFSRQALEQKDPQFILLVRSWPDYGPIRTDPRFVEIVEHLHLPGGPSPLSKSLA